FPVALGALYNGQALPPKDTGGDKNNVKMFMTRSGNQIVFNDEDGKEQISIVNKDGSNKIVMEMSGPSITIESKGDINIKGKNLTLESQEALNLKAGTELKTKASSNAEFEASANMKVKAGAMLEIQGTTVTVKGNPIQLN
ncbi:MAG: hypothetical protein AB1746_06310, partial [Candidatus Zixiibacteriota bacterium]